MSIAELRPASAPGNISSAEELVARARALAPKLRERAVRAERDRNIPQEFVDEFIEAGLIHTLQPKRWGGYEHDHEVAFDIAVENGQGRDGHQANKRGRSHLPCVIPAKPGCIGIHYYASRGYPAFWGLTSGWLHPGRSVYVQGMCPMREFQGYFSVVTRPVTSAGEVTSRCHG